MRGNSGKNIYSQVSPNTSTQMDTAKAHIHITIRCELTAVFPCLILFGDFVSSTESCRFISYISFRGAKIMEIFHASKTFAIYLTDSCQFQGLKGSTSCYFMRILCSFHPIHHSFPLTGERDVSFWRYGVRCFIYIEGLFICFA